MAMYLIDSKGTYPPAWCQDDLNADSPQYYGQSGHNYTWATLLRKYLGIKNDDINKSSNLEVYKCPSDTGDRAGWLAPDDRNALSYAMPDAPRNDTIFYKQRKPIPTSQNPMRNPGTASCGIGQIFNKNYGYGLWIHTSMVKPVTNVILLVERAYDEQAQNTVFSLGYEVKGPNYQLYANTQGSQQSGYRLLPILHARKGQEKIARFNYLFCDYHVEAMNASDTVHDPNTLLPPSSSNYIGGDFMWTIRPFEFK
jgi:hypothetical protein